MMEAAMQNASCSSCSSTWASVSQGWKCSSTFLWVQLKICFYPAQSGCSQPQNFTIYLIFFVALVLFHSPFPVCSYPSYHSLSQCVAAETSPPTNLNFVNLNYLLLWRVSDSWLHVPLTANEEFFMPSDLWLLRGKPFNLWMGSTYWSGKSNCSKIQEEILTCKKKKRTPNKIKQLSIYVGGYVALW